MANPEKLKLYAVQAKTSLSEGAIRSTSGNTFGLAKVLSRVFLC